jgi:hypothetical protein
MSDPIKNVEPVAAVPATPQVPASQGQSTPEKTGVSSNDVKTVPLPALQEERARRQEEQSARQSLEAEVAELRRLVNNTQMQQQFVQQPQPIAPRVDPREELNKTWEEDPRQAVQLEIMYAMDWRDRIDSGLEVQADALARKYPDFNNFRSVALGQVRSLPLNQRGSQGILEAAYFMVRGQNTDSIIQQREQELLERYRRGDFNAAGLATAPGSFSTPSAVEGVALSQDQLNTAYAMGLTPEQYKSAMVNK